MGHLQELGMRKGWIYETIVSTFSHEVPHAAPIGVWTEQFNELHMEMYDSSHTLRNILNTGHFVANFPPDVALFHAALFHSAQLAFEPAQEIESPLLSGSSAAVELVLRQASPLPGRMRITGVAVHVLAREDISLLNRGEGLLLESLFITTRLPHLDNAAARGTLAENYRVIRKVAPRSHYEEAMADVLRNVDVPS